MCTHLHAQVDPEADSALELARSQRREAEWFLDAARAELAEAKLRLEERDDAAHIHIHILYTSDATLLYVLYRAASGWDATDYG